MSSSRLPPSRGPGRFSGPRGAFDEDVHGDPSFDFREDGEVPGGSKVRSKVGVDERAESIRSIEDRLMFVLDADGYLEGTSDILGAEHWVKAIAPEVHRRECALRIILDAMLEGNLTLRHGEAAFRFGKDIIKDTWFEIPYDDVMRKASPDRLIVEVDTTKHAYIIRRKT